MKKIISILLVLLLLTGCSKKEKLQCSFENKHNNVKFKTVINVDVKNNKIVNAIATMNFEDEEFAKTMCEILKNAEDSGDNLKCDKKKIVIQDYQKSISEEEITKEDFLEYMKNQKYECK